MIDVVWPEMAEASGLTVHQACLPHSTRGSAALIWRRGSAGAQPIARGAALLLGSAEERLKGASALPVENFNADLRQALITNCTQERDSVRALIERAGVTLALDKKGKEIVRLELDPPRVAAPVRLNTTELMNALLPGSPGWYTPASSIVHSRYWGLRDAVGSAPGEPLALTPALLEVGAAVETAISASGLILARCAGYYGHDPHVHAERTEARYEAVDLRMRRYGQAQMAQRGHPAASRSSS